MLTHSHNGDPYDANGQWLIMDSVSDFVASAVWRAPVKRNGPFDGPSAHDEITRIEYAESNVFSELEKWAERQKALGCDTMTFYRTWPIDTGKFAGKRDNARI